MFTGIIQTIGTVESRSGGSEGDSFTVRAAPLVAKLVPGDSVAVNGVCQTVESVVGDRFTFTAVGETLARTTLGDLADKRRVNLELAATPETALGGHLVQGPVNSL